MLLSLSFIHIVLDTVTIVYLTNNHKEGKTTFAIYKLEGKWDLEFKKKCAIAD